MNGLSRWRTTLEAQLERQGLYRLMRQPLLLTLLLSLVVHLLWLQPVEAPAMRLMSSAQTQNLPVSIAFAAAPKALLSEPDEATEASIAEGEPTLDKPQRLKPVPLTEPKQTVTQQKTRPALSKPAARKPMATERGAEEQVAEQLQVAAVESSVAALSDDALSDDALLPVITEPSFSVQPQPPVYPKLALKRRWQGQALVKALVNELGETERVELLESTGFDLLDQSALKAVNGWHFAAAEQGLRKIRAWVQVPVNFTIR